MIEVKGIGIILKWSFRLFCALISAMLFWALFLSINYSNYLASIMIVAFSMMPITFLYFYKRRINKIVIRVETEENLYQLTFLNKEKYLLDPDSVIRVLRNDQAYLLVLENGLKFYLPKGMLWWISSRDPWKLLLTEKRFRYAEFKYTLFFW
jgi:hypothetical protein